MNSQPSLNSLDTKGNNMCRILRESYPSPPPSPNDPFPSPPPSPNDTYHGSHESGCVRSPSEVNIPFGDDFKPESLENAETNIQSEEPKKKKLKPIKLYKETLYSTWKTKVSKRPGKKSSKFDLKKDGYATHCYVCENLVKPDNLTFHLYFGDLKCEYCGKVITSCMKFGNINTGSKNIEICKHEKLEWVFPPVDTLKRLFNEEEEAFDETLTQYLKSLKPLRKYEPFNTAIRYCNDYLKEKLKSKELTELSEDLPRHTTANNARTSDIFHVTDSSSTSQSSNINEKTNLKAPLRMKIKHANNCNVPYLLQSLLHTNTASKRIIKSESAKGKEHHGINRTISAVTHSPFETNTTEGNQKWKQDSSKEEEEHEIFPDLLNNNNFYFITRKAINECPNCYESLDPKKLKFYTSNFLIECTCTGCELLILFVFDPPDNTKPRLKIIHVA